MYFLFWCVVKKFVNANKFSASSENIEATFNVFREWQGHVNEKNWVVSIVYLGDNDQTDVWKRNSWVVAHIGNAMLFRNMIGFGEMQKKMETL